MIQNLTLILIEHLNEGFARLGPNLRLTSYVASLLVGIAPFLYLSTGFASRSASLVDT